MHFFRNFNYWQMHKRLQLQLQNFAIIAATKQWKMQHTANAVLNTHTLQTCSCNQTPPALWQTNFQKSFSANHFFKGFAKLCCHHFESACTPKSTHILIMVGMYKIFAKKIEEMPFQPSTLPCKQKKCIAHKILYMQFFFTKRQYHCNKYHIFLFILQLPLYIFQY